MDPAAVLSAASQSILEESSCSFLSDGSDVVIDHMASNCGFTLEPAPPACDYTVVSDHLARDCEYTIVTDNAGNQTGYAVVNPQMSDACEYAVLNEPLSLNCDYTIVSEQRSGNCNYLIDNSFKYSKRRAMFDSNTSKYLGSADINQSKFENSVEYIYEGSPNQTLELLNEQNSANRKLEEIDNEPTGNFTNIQEPMPDNQEQILFLNSSVMQNNMHNSMIEATMHSYNVENINTFPIYQTVPRKMSPVYRRVISPKMYQPRRRSLIASPMQKHVYQNLPEPRTKVRRSSLQSSPLGRAPVYMNVPMSSPKEGNQTRHGKTSGQGNGVDTVSSSSTDLLNGTMNTCASTKGSPTYIQMTSPFVRSPVSSVYAQLATVLSSYAGHSGKTIFCPLCPRQLTYERSLINHIQRTHRFELEEMVNGQPGDLVLQSCPLCQGRFFNTAVLPKHLLDCHKNELVELLEKHSCLKRTAEKLHCPFCVKTEPLGVNGDHMMIFHLQRFHSAQFSDMITNKFDPRVIAPESLQKTRLQSTSMHLLTPELCGRMDTLLKTSDSKRKLSDVQKEDLNLLKSARNNSGSSVEKKYVRTPLSAMRPGPKKATTNRSILRSEKNLGKRKGVKRELRFSVPHVTKEKMYYPESPRTTDSGKDATFVFNNSQIFSGHKNSESLISAQDIIDMDQPVARKRRRLHIRSNIFRCKDKENLPVKLDVSDIQTTENTKVYRRPRVTLERQKPVTRQQQPSKGSPCASKLFSTSVNLSDTQDSIAESDISSMEETRDIQTAKILKDQNQLSSVKLYSQLRMFRCNTCNTKYCDNVSLMLHVSQNHRGLLSLLRAQFGCGICPSKFYDNKQLVKHSLQNHTSLLEIRDGSNYNEDAVKTRNREEKRIVRNRNDDLITSL